MDGWGEGASVELNLEVNGNEVIIQSSPSSGERVNLDRSTKTNSGTWKFYNCNANANLCATLEQNRPQRTIKYRLYRE